MLPIKYNIRPTNALQCLMCSMSVHCIIRNNKHQLMHQNIYNLYSWKSATCCDPAKPSSGRMFLIYYGCVYTVKCECALGFILPLRCIVYSPRSVSARHRLYTLNCINATIVYQKYSPWIWPNRVETYSRLSRIKIIYTLVPQLFIISYSRRSYITVLIG
jgi:hypothetical protein